MARLVTCTTGNFTDSTKWGVCDTTMMTDSVTTQTNITSSTTAHITPNKQPGAITVDGVAIKISARQASGIFTVVLRKTTARAADIATVTTAVVSLGLGWHFFKFTTPVTLLAATNYAIRLTCSSSNGVTVNRGATTNDFSRLLRTTTTAAPAAGDQLIISNQFMTGSSITPCTITMDNTASTVFGATTYVDSLSVGGLSTLTWGTATSTNYLLTIKGLVSVWSGATWNQGTSGARIPSSSTAKLIFSPTTNVDSGFTANPGSVVNRYGNIVTASDTLMTASIGGYCTTSGTAVTRDSGEVFTGMTGTLKINGVNYTISSVNSSSSITLTGSAGIQSKVQYVYATTATTLTVASTSDWAVGNLLGIASTSRTAANCETAVIQSVDSSTQVTLTTALINHHSGDTPTQTEVIHLTRNVVVAGTSTTLQGYCIYDTTSIINDSYVEFYWLGSATANRRGIDIQTTTGSYTGIGNVLRNFTVASSIGYNIAFVNYNNISITYTNTYGMIFNSILMSNNSSSGVVTVDHFISMLNTGIALAFSNPFSGVTITNIKSIGCSSNPITMLESTYDWVGVYSNITCHSNASSANFSALSMTINNLTVWRSNGTGATLQNSVNVKNGLIFGSANNLSLTDNFSEATISGVRLSADIIFSSTTGVLFGSGSSYNVSFFNCIFGEITSIYVSNTYDIDCSSVYMSVYCKNCLFSTGIRQNLIWNYDERSFISSERHNQISGANNRYSKGSSSVLFNESSDSVVYNTASPAATSTHRSLTVYTRTAYTNPIPIDGGQAATVTVKIYKSATYNGIEPFLVLLKNDTVGFLTDTTLATTVGAVSTWLTLSGTTPTATADGCFVCCIEFSGTIGSITVDDWVVS